MATRKNHLLENTNSCWRLSGSPANRTDRFDIRESDPLPERQASAYGQTKLASEGELLALRDQGTDVLIFRPRAVFGPHDTTFLPRIRLMSEKRRFPLINHGRATVDITYIDNLVHAVEKALSAPAQAWNEVYNISNGEPISLHDWFAEMCRMMGRPFKPKNVPRPVAACIAGLAELAMRCSGKGHKPALTRFSVGYMAKSMTLCLDKARHRLGYSPIVNNREAFDQLAKWCNPAS